MLEKKRLYVLHETDQWGADTFGVHVFSGPVDADLGDMLERFKRFKSELKLPLAKLYDTPDDLPHSFVDWLSQQYEWRPFPHTSSHLVTGFRDDSGPMIRDVKEENDA